VEPDELIAFAEEAARAWPTVRVPLPDFVAYVRSKLDSGDSVPLASLHGADLYLAFACCGGDHEAWRALDRTYLVKVPAYVASVDRSSAFADEVRQRISEKLASHDTAGGASKLAQYSGRGALASWLRVAALREARTLVRGRQRGIDHDEVTLRAPDVDPELALLKRRCAEVFRRAFAEVVESLPEDERTLLRLHYLDGLTLEEVARASRVSRASAARALAQARERVMKRVERTIRDDVGAQGPGAQSLLALARSQLDLSILRRFGGKPDAHE
jgi:RNA polymerase sigma-70 factor (ECF subfamily)